jgi:lipoprotein NlpI
MTRRSDDDNGSELQDALARVEQLYVAGDYEGRIALCTELIEQFPMEPMPYYERGQAQNVLGLQRAALDDMTKAVERKPDEVRFAWFRGLWSLELGDPTTAVQDCTTVIELENESDPSGYWEAALQLRALARLLLGQFDLAQRDLDILESEDEEEDEMWVGPRSWTPTQMRQLIAQRRRPF